jgi:hypothetical protein
LRTRRWTLRAAAAGCAAVLGLGLVGSGVASAQDDTSTEPAPITVSPQQVKQLCEQRVPRLEGRLNRLVNRINGGPDVVGSTAWLHQQAQQAKANGRQTRADALENRAGRRDDVLGRLRGAQQKLATFKSNHCNDAGGEK